MRYLTIREHLLSYLTPLNFTYLWSFGSLVGLFLAIQIISGVLIAMHYTPHINEAFFSIEHLMRDVEYGWFFRYLHSNGASFIFIFLFLHIGKGIYYTSFFYPFGNLWRIGMILFLLMMATAFLGYVLPWGQMSYWGATVITNLFTAIPKLGFYIVQLLWGGFSIDNATLNRFFSLHFILPIIIIIVILLHLSLLHSVSSSHMLKIEDNFDKLPFYIYFYLKDLISFFLFFFIFCLFIFFYPNILGHSDNYITADPLNTPSHIVPEWYFLPFYAILRSIPNKLIGVIAMFAAILIIFLLPSFFLFFRNRYTLFTNFWLLNVNYRPFWLFFFWFFSGIFILLGWIGQMVVEQPYIFIGFLLMLFYFFLFIFIMPFIFYLELDSIFFYLAQKNKLLLKFFQKKLSLIDLEQLSIQKYKLLQQKKKQNLNLEQYFIKIAEKNKYELAFSHLKFKINFEIRNLKKKIVSLHYDF